MCTEKGSTFLNLKLTMHANQDFIRGRNCCCAGHHYLFFAGWTILTFQLVSLAFTWRVPVVAGLDGLTETSTNDYIARLNYGFVAIKTKAVCVTEGYVTHAFHISLPKRTSSEREPLNLTRCSAEISVVACRRMASLVESVAALTVSMRRTVNEMIDKAFRLIPDIKRPELSKSPTRFSRGLVDIVGSALSFAFGTATQADVEDLAKEINTIKGLSAEAAADAQRTREGFASFTKMSNERIDRIHDVLNEDHVVLSSAVRQIHRLQETSTVEYNAITYVTRELARFVVIHDGIQQLKEGIEDLSQGHLTPNLIAVEMLEPVLTNLSERLRKDDLILCYNSARSIYDSRNFDVARSGLDLFVRVRIPYTDMARMYVYETSVVSLPVPGKDNWVTTIKDIPPIILVAPSHGTIGELVSIPDRPVIEKTTIKWHDSVRKSCLYYVLADEIDSVKNVCDFTTGKRIKGPSYFRLSPGSYVLSNFKDLSIDCPSRQRNSLLECDPCRVILGCGCKLSTGITEIATHKCPENSTESNVAHAVNLIVLQHFYDTTNLTLTGKTLTTEEDKLFPEPVDWKLYGEKVDKLLAADDTASYSLKKLALSLQNDSLIYHSPAEAMLSDIIHEQANHKLFGIDLSIFNSWLIVILIIIVGIIIVFHFRMRKKLNNTSHLVQRLGVTAALIGTTKSQSIQLKATTTLPTISVDHYEALLTFIQDDLVSFWINIILTMILILIASYSFYWLTRMRSYVYIELRTREEVFMIYYKRLPDASRCFDIVTSIIPTIVTVVNCLLFGYLKFEGNTWKIEDKRTRQRTSLPRRVLLLRSDMLQAKAMLLNSDCCVEPVVVHTHEQIRRPVEDAEEPISTFE